MRRLIKFMRRLGRWAYERFTAVVASVTGRPPDKGPPLEKISNVQVEVDMSGNVTLTWANPTARRDGQAADGSEFEVRIGLKATAAPSFTPVQVVPGTDPASASFPNTAGGDYEFELTLYDLVLDRAQTPIIAPFSVPQEDLEPLTSVNVTVE